MSERPAPHLAQTNWDKFTQTNANGPKQIGKGDSVRIRKGNRPADLVRSIEKRIPFHSSMADRMRLHDYQDLINNLINERLTDADANTQLQAIWERNRQALSEGGVLDMKVIEKILGDVYEDGIITENELASLLEIILEGQDQRANPYRDKNQWDNTADVVRARTLRMDDDSKMTTDTTKKGKTIKPLKPAEASSQIVTLLSDPRLREEWVDSVRKYLKRSNVRDIEDVTQDIVQQYTEKLINSRDEINFSEIANVNSYLKTGLKRTTADYFRQRKIDVPDFDFDLVSDPTSTKESKTANTLQDAQEEMAQRIIDFVQENIPNSRGTFFGVSFKKGLAPGTFIRYPIVITGKLTGKTSLEIAQEIAKVDPKFAQKYAPALLALTQDPTTRRIPSKALATLTGQEYAVAESVNRMGNMIDQLYKRGKERIEQELGFSIGGPSDPDQEDAN